MQIGDKFKLYDVDYIAVPETNKCQGCDFYENNCDCKISDNVDCFENKIIFKNTLRLELESLKNKITPSKCKYEVEYRYYYYDSGYMGFEGGLESRVKKEELYLTDINKESVIDVLLKSNNRFKKIEIISILKVN